MDLSAVRDEVILNVSGGLIELEIPDAVIDKYILASMREMNRYYDSYITITVPYAQCIDLSQYKINSVLRVFRAHAISSDINGGQSLDPMLASQWQLLSGYGNLKNLNDYVYNYAAWNTLLQLRNTTSTDLAFTFDKHDKKLYVNISSNTPSAITLEYVPILETVDQITSEYWLDVLIKLATARVKVGLGVIRSRFSQAGALWTQDGETMRNEGTAELNELRNTLAANSNLCLPID